MADDVVIRAEGLGKQYTIGHAAERESYVALRDVLARGARNMQRSAMDILRGRPIVAGDELEEFWALKDLNFEIKRGEVVGIIGRNGAGKSTLLKILSRITEPSVGRVTIHGRVASLLEVGTGFHPELTGRENIYLNGAILGMSRAEIKRKFDEIVDFAEVERFLDTPVKRYSSGMYVRLAFAVAAHLEPEILIVDEVLAVGDSAFQEKCLGKMEDVAKGGRTVIFVSHTLSTIRTLTQRAFLLEGGRVALSGPSPAVVENYLASARTFSAGVHPPICAYARDKPRNTEIWVESITAHSAPGSPTTCFSFDQPDPITLSLVVTTRHVFRGVHISIWLRNQRGECVSILYSEDSVCLADLNTGNHLIEADITGAQLPPGAYFVDIGLSTGVGQAALDVILQYPIFQIAPTEATHPWPDRPWGAVHLRNVEWRQSALTAITIP